MRLAPDLMVNAVPDLTPQKLTSHGIKAVMVDLDDTLVASNTSNLTEAFSHWINGLKLANIPIVILSNGSPERVRYWSRQLDVQGFALVGKPLSFAFRRGLKYLGSTAQETAMIGDQLFTDILGANLAGMRSILVTPLSPGKLLHTRLIRKLESRVLPRGGDYGRSVNRG